MSAFALAATSRSPLDLDRLLERAHAPLEHRLDGVVAVGEVQPQHLLDALADHVLLLEARERERVLAAADHAPLAVADEEGGVGRRVVVVEQFEQEREAALRAALALAREADVAVDLARAVAAVGADEGMGHGVCTQTTQAAPGRPPHPRGVAARLEQRPLGRASAPRGRGARRRRASPRARAGCA